MSAFEEGNFLAIRMIVLKHNVDPTAFETFMIGTLLPEMWAFFSANGRGLKGITFLRGNKRKEGFPSGPPHPRMSQDGAGTDRSDSTAAGANADYAWITCWTSKEINENIWKNDAPDARPAGWDDIWRQFRDDWCHKGSRPMHGPPYDSVGASGIHRDPPHPPNPHIEHHGRGAGCLVEGFEVIKEWPLKITAEAPPGT